MNFGIERIHCGVSPRHEGHYIDDDGFHMCADCCEADRSEIRNRAIIRRNHLGIATGQGRPHESVDDEVRALTIPMVVVVLAGVAIAATILFSR